MIYNYFTVIHNDSKELEEEFEKEFKKRGNWKKSSKNIDFLYIDEDETKSIKNKMTYKKVGIKNIIDLKSVENVVDKFKLIDNLQKKFPDFAKKYTLQQFLIKKNKKYPELSNIFDKNVWILKPIDGFSGKGIKIFDNFNDFDKFNKTYNEYVLQSYIRNPLLINGKKFHLRMFLLETIIDNKINTYLLRKGGIYTSSKKFKFNTFNDKNIHNSHLKSTSEKQIFPDDYLKIFNLKKTIEIFKHIIRICKKIAILLKDTKCYPESKNCYYIYGLDIMITDDGRVFLIECNKKIKHYTLIYFDLVSEIVETTFKNMIDKIYPPKNKIEYNNDFFYKIS